jgi:hypothetical protein
VQLLLVFLLLVMGANAGKSTAQYCINAANYQHMQLTNPPNQAALSREDT